MEGGGVVSSARPDRTFQVSSGTSWRFQLLQGIKDDKGGL